MSLRSPHISPLFPYKTLCRADAYTRFFYYYNATPLLIVNAEQIDLVNNDQDYQLLLERVGQMGNGRHYYNPIPFD